MDLMINSIYTNKEIFLREIISNASDAIDKLYYNSLTDKKIKINKDDFKINISINRDERTLTISDNGIGMNDVDLENNLGTIAKSGTLAFKESADEKKSKDNIKTEVRIGKRVDGYITKIREDGRIDVSLQEPGLSGIEHASKLLLKVLKTSNGYLEFNDKSDPQDIEDYLHMSKGKFK